MGARFRGETDFIGDISLLGIEFGVLEWDRSVLPSLSFESFRGTDLTGEIEGRVCLVRDAGRIVSDDSSCRNGD